MPIDSRLSRMLLVFEALLLLLPSLFGLTMFFGCFISVFVGKAEQPFIFNVSLLLALFSYLSCLLAFLSFYSFWHIYADVMTREFEKGKKLNRAISLLAFLGFVLSIAAITLVEFKITIGIEIFGIGILYVPTYLHLLFQIKRQTGSDYLFGTIF
jgi:hypothetical protein